LEVYDGRPCVSMNNEKQGMDYRSKGWIFVRIAVCFVTGSCQYQLCHLRVNSRKHFQELKIMGLNEFLYYR
jgi:hypothetical protein